jgi:hypothetical protein
MVILSQAMEGRKVLGCARHLPLTGSQFGGDLLKFLEDPKHAD